jgi:diaminopimelate epimerase
MCGNGIRCIGKYLIDAGEVAPDAEIAIATAAGLQRIRLVERLGREDRLTVNMGPAFLEPGDLPFDEQYGSRGGTPHVATLAVDGMTLDVALVSMGNPHAVAFIEEPVATFPLERIGPLVEHHPAFPRRTNFEIVNRTGSGAVMRVWERGAGETLACGTGACAVGVANRLLHGQDATQTVSLPGGDLTIDWDGHGDVFMTGPAAEVFRGAIAPAAERGNS